jgi:uncharacterized cupin superfamily protein
MRGFTSAVGDTSSIHTKSQIIRLRDNAIFTKSRGDGDGAATRGQASALHPWQDRDVRPHASFLSDGFEYDADDPDGYRSGVINIGKALGARALAVKVFEIPTGQHVCPYHYEYEEEWLIVLDGAVSLRTPDGEQTLERGAIVAFPSGPAGAHKVSSGGQASARVMMFSSAREPAVAVYPDSDKIGVWPGNADDHVILRRSDGAVDYYDGEL